MVNEQNITVMLEHLDRHMTELSSLTVLPRCPMEEKV